MRISDDDEKTQKEKWINDYSKLSDITIIDTPNIDSYDMITKASSLNTYQLNGVNWIITEQDEQYYDSGIRIKENDLEYANKGYYFYSIEKEIYDEYTGNNYVFSEEDKENGVILYKKAVLYEEENGIKNIVSIPVLEYLKSKQPKENETSSLTGTITIDLDNAKVNEYDIYQHYIMDLGFKGIEIIYNENKDKVQVTKASKIEFYNQPNIEEGSKPFYIALTDGAAEEDIPLKDIVEDNIIKGPIKSSTNYNDYEFKYWLIRESLVLFPFSSLQKFVRLYKRPHQLLFIFVHRILLEHLLKKGPFLFLTQDLLIVTYLILYLASIQSELRLDALLKDSLIPVLTSGYSPHSQ